MTQSNYFLAIDNGKKSVRAMVFGQHGTLVAKTKIGIAVDMIFAACLCKFFTLTLCRYSIEDTTLTTL